MKQAPVQPEQIVYAPLVLMLVQLDKWFQVVVQVLQILIVKRVRQAIIKLMRMVQRVLNV